MSDLNKIISISLDDKTKTGLDNIDQTFKDVDQSIKGAEKTSSNLRQELKQLQRDLLSGKFTGEEFAQATAKAGELRDTIGDLNGRIKVLASDTQTLDGLISAAEGLAGGFAIAQGAAALLGGENEELQETLLKVQSSMAILQGLQSVANALQKESAAAILASNVAERINNFIKTGKISLAKQEIVTTEAQTVATTASTAATTGATTAMRLFRIALLATGIGVAVVAIGALAEAMDLFGNNTKDATQELENFKNEMSLREDMYKFDNDLIDQNEKLALAAAKKRGASEEELTKIIIDAKRKRLAEADEEVRKNAEYADNQLKAGKRFTEEFIKKSKEDLDNQKKFRDDLEVAIAEADADADQRKRTREEKAAKDAEAARVKRFEKEKADTIKNGEDIQSALNRIAKKRVDDEIALKAEADAILKGVKEWAETPAQKLEREYLEEKAILEKAHANTLTLTAKFITEKKALEDAGKQKQQDDDKARRDKEISDEQILADAKRAITLSYLDSASGLIGIVKALGEKNKGLQRIALIADSAVGIAKVIINTQAANAAALAKYSPIPGGAAIAAAEITANKVAAGVGIAANLVATSKALSALGGGGAGAGNAGGAGGAGAPQAQFNIVGQSSTNQLAGVIANRPEPLLRAFVVASDVSTQQALDRNRINNSTFI